MKSHTDDPQICDTENWRTRSYLRMKCTAFLSSAKRKLSHSFALLQGFSYSVDFLSSRDASILYVSYHIDVGPT